MMVVFLHSMSSVLCLVLCVWCSVRRVHKEKQYMNSRVSLKAWKCLGVAVLTAMSMKGTVFCVVTPSSSERRSTFLSSISPPSSGLKSKPSKQRII
jgi:4-amino-4-deoxy-L-arabinose transferase-like glycosyltransferase